MKAFIQSALLTLVLGLAACGGGSGSISFFASGSGGTGGVGSGGTGISASVSGIGAVDGLSSVIMNGVRFATDTAQIITEDADSLQLGMTVRVSGTIDPGLTTGQATEVLSIPELRGAVTTVDAPAGQFELLGVMVTIDEATAFAGISGLGDVQVGQMLQVYALPAGPGQMRATRVEALAVGTHIRVYGPLQDLNTGAGTFRLGTVTVNYAAASFAGGLDAAALANGMSVYVKAPVAPFGSVLNASQIYRGHTLPAQSTSAVTVLGMVADFASLQSFTLQGIPVNAASAQITGGQSAAIGNGVKLDVVGSMASGVLVASKVRIRHVPGTGGPVSFNVIGPVGQFKSVASFRVNGQPINASGPAVVFTNGVAADLKNGTKVNIKGSQVVDGVLQATEILFE